MSRVPINRLLIVLLVCYPKTLAETGPPNGLNDHSLNNEHGETGNDKSNSLINEVSTESSASSREDSDPAESSETIVYNRFANPVNDEESRSSVDEDPEGPTDHAIPYSEHELSKEVPTRPKYTGPGQWAKPTKSRDVSSDEVPSKLYAQVRRTHTVRRLPRKRAFQNAESEEERENAARLRKVVRNSKVNTVYTEEGYEDSAYDHAGHARDADFDEGYARKVQQQLNSRKNSRDGGDKHSGKSEKNKRIDPEEFKDYDEDNGANYETTTDHSRMDDEETRWTNSAYPKLVVESGVQKLQEDLEREVEEIEKGVEIRKLESSVSKQDGVTASPRKDDYRRKSLRNRSGKRREPSSTEELDEDLDEKVGEQSQDSQDNNVYMENYSTSRTPGDEELISMEHGGPETTTIANNIEMLTNGPSETYRYEVEGNSPVQSEMIDFQGVQNPTTVSYSQLFWDYFKAQQNQYTTLSPFIVESATVSPNVLLSSSGVENAFAPYSYAELTTPFPIVDSPIPNAQQFISAQTLANPQYPEQQQLAALGAFNTNEQDVKWQSLNVQEPPKTETNIASDLVLEPINNLDSKEASFNKVFSNPVTSMNRKPRYKITMRPKAIKPTESSETVMSNSINQDRKEGTSPESIALNPNYVKMLMHLRNEEGAKKMYSSPPRSNLYFQSWMDGLTKMRPPVPQKEASYQNFMPHNSHGSVKLGPLHRTSSAPLARKRSSQPSNSLLPPAIADHRGRKEADYVKPKRIRNVPRQGFRPTVIEAISRSRGKRRERRSPGWESGDEAGGSTTAAKPSANNTASNRSEIERATKNSLAAVKRNPRQKVTRDVEVGLVPDTIGLTADSPDGKKSRSSENDRGGGSRGSVVGGFSLGEGESVSCAGSMEDGEDDGKVPSELDASKNDEEKVRIGGGSVNWNGSDEEKKLGMRTGWKELEVGLDRINGTVGSGKNILSEVDDGFNQTSGSVGYVKNILRSGEKGLYLAETSEANGHGKPNLREVGEGLNQTSGTVGHDQKILREVDDGLNHTSGSVGYVKNILRSVEKGLNLAQPSEANGHGKPNLREVGEGFNQTSGTVGHGQKMLWEVDDGLNQRSGSVGFVKKILRSVDEGLNLAQTNEANGHGKPNLREVGEGLNQTSGTVGHDQKILRKVDDGLNQNSGSVGFVKKILRSVEEGLNLAQTNEANGRGKPNLREVGEGFNQTSGTVGHGQKMLWEVDDGLNQTSGSVGYVKNILRSVDEGLNLAEASEANGHDKPNSRVVGEGLNQTSGTVGHDQRILRKVDDGLNQNSGSVGFVKKILRSVEEGLNLAQTNEANGHGKPNLREVAEGLNQTSGTVGHDQKILREVDDGLNHTIGSVGFVKKIFRSVEKGLKLAQTSKANGHGKPNLREVGAGLNHTSGTVGYDQKILREVDDGLNHTSGTVGFVKKIFRSVEKGLKLAQTSKANGHGKPNLREVGEGLNHTSGTVGYDQKILREMDDGLNQTSETIGHDANIMEAAKADWSQANGNVGHDQNLLSDVKKGFNLTHTSEFIGHDQKLLDDVEVKGKFEGAVELKKPTPERDYDSNLENMDGGNDSIKIKKMYENLTNIFQKVNQIDEKVISDKKKEGGGSRNIPELSIIAKVNEEEIYRSSKKNESEKDKVLEEPKENKKTMINRELFRPKRSHREFNSEIDSDSNKTEDVYQEKNKSIHLDKAEEKNIEKDSVTEKEEQSNMKSHEDLLQESPEVTDDVINKEIEARFNDNEEQKEDTDENDGAEKVEVEIPEVPDFDYVEEIAEEEDTDSGTTMESTVDRDKYPFYESEKLPTPSALRYATNPEKVPGKTYGRMNFYRSRDVYKHCDEVEPNLDVLPSEEKPIAEKGVNEKPQRLKGLGDKLDCFKAKYFDDDPFDNPLFLEQEVSDPLPPLDLNSKKFASRIMLFPKDDDRNVVQKSSKRPENHQNHKDQPRQRKPKPANARPQKSRRVRIKSYSRPVGSRPRVVRIKSSSVRYVKPRRPQKIVRRPLSSASEMSALYTPYQNQVYEDVMGTIKNMANSYQVEEITTVPTSKETEVTEMDIMKTNASSNSTQAGKTEKDRKSSNSEEQSNSSDAKVEGMAPPRHSNRHRLMYKRVRVPQKSKSRLQLVQVTPNRLRPLNHRQLIIRYKRGARDHERGFFDRSAELRNIGGASNETSEENVWGIEDKQERVRTLESDPIEKNGTSNTFSKSAELKEDSKVPTTVPSSSSDGKVESPKIIYTIRDRIRYSKPKGEISRVGKFTNKSEAVEDHRRKEPKYNSIKRRKPVPVPSTTELSLMFSTEPFLSATTHRTVEDNSRELMKENKQVQHLVNDTRSEKSNPTIEPDQSSVELSTVSTNKTGHGYAVHENLSEEQTTTQEPPDFSRLNSFLGFVSPSYTDFSSEEFKKSIFSNETKASNSSLNLAGSKESLENENNAPKTVHQSYFSDEDSSEKAGGNTNAEPSNESSEEGSASKNNDSKEGRTFFSYWNRPSSPAENYEDEKYKDLGPRLNKPAFFHPPFSFLKSRKSFFRNGSEEDSEEEMDEYVFPWHRDKKNEKKRRKRNRFYDKSIGDYEYPWERRERLSRKSRRLDDEEDYDNAQTTKYRRNANPRGKIRFWTRRDDSSEENDSDNIESETRPVKKYSSNYSAKKRKLPEAASAQSEKVEEISRSIKEILEGEEKSSDEKSKVKPGDSGEKKAASRVVARGIVPEDVTLAPRRSAKKDAILLKSATINRTSNGLLRNSLDNGESRLAVEKANQVKSKSETNSTLQQNKRRRRPAKNLLNVETTTKSAVNRGRRRQKMATTPTISVTPTPRLVRRKSSKTVNDLKKNHLKNKDTLNNGDLGILDSSVGENRTMEHRANVSHGNDTERNGRVSEEKVVAKNGTSWETKMEEVKDKLNGGKDSEKKNTRVSSSESEVVDKREDLGHHGGGGDGIGESKDVVTPVNDDGKFDFMDERIEALSDLAKTDDVLGDDEFGFDSIVKSEGGVIPHNRATQLSQQESREIILTKSWISQNNNF